jgi:hypothetical protein
MFVTSRTYNSFCLRLKKDAMQILNNEMQCKTARERFERHGKLYPLSIVLFEHPRCLGRYEHSTLSIAINKGLVNRGGREVLLNLLRHELVHYLCAIDHGVYIDPHGPEFQQMCKRFGYGPEVAKATIEDSAIDMIKLDDERSRLLQKVQKLMKLGESQNPHEATLATLKANDLLIKYNLDHHELHAQTELEVYRARVLEFKRRSAKTDAIIDILRPLSVEALYAQGPTGCAIEVIGARVNVELADYTAKYLNSELELLLDRARKTDPNLSGLTARNSFFKGVAKGFSEALEKQNDQHFTSTELELRKQRLQEQVALFYPRLGRVTHQSQTDLKALRQGMQAGEKLSFRPGLKPESSTKLLAR